MWTVRAVGGSESTISGKVKSTVAFFGGSVCSGGVFGLSSCGSSSSVPEGRAGIWDIKDDIDI
jgi:hypothetical protein